MRARLVPRPSASTGPGASRGLLGFIPKVLGGLRWRWVVVAGAGVTILGFLLVRALLYSYVLVPYFLGLGVPKRVDPAYTDAMVAFVIPAAHLMLTAVAASFVARRAGTAPRRHGLAVGLASVVMLQAIGLAYGPLRLTEVALYSVLGVVGGLLGASWARRALAGRESLYRAIEVNEDGPAVSEQDCDEDPNNPGRPAPNCEDLG